MLDSEEVSHGAHDDQLSLFDEGPEGQVVKPSESSTIDNDKVGAEHPDRNELESLKAVLEASGDYKVLRRSGTSGRLTPPDPMPTSGVRRGLYLDVETTGLDVGDPIIELGAVLFEYHETGRVLRVLEEFDEFEDPGRPLPPGIVQLTGITDPMVAGRRIDDSKVARLATGADLVIAHNAGFDRPIVEKRFPLFRALPWACSVVDVDWQRAGMRTRKLEYLAMTRGFFFDSHRAINDCIAGVELLADALIADDDETALASLLANSGRESVRLWAENSPFETKGLLKERRYRWNAASKLWWRDLAGDEHDAELQWLESSVYQRMRPLPYYRFDAASRYSSRIPMGPPKDATRR